MRPATCLRVAGPIKRGALSALVFEGGVAGGVPPHKGGPKARPSKKGVAPGGGGGLPTTALSRLSGEGCAGPP